MARSWSYGDELRLRELAAAGLTLPEALKHFPNRTYNALRHKAKQLDIRFRRAAAPVWYTPKPRTEPDPALLRINRLDTYSALAREGFRELERGLLILSRHARDGHVVLDGVKMTYSDAISALLQYIHTSARLIREARGEA